MMCGQPALTENEERELNITNKFINLHEKIVDLVIKQDRIQTYFVNKMIDLETSFERLKSMVDRDKKDQWTFINDFCRLKYTDKYTDKKYTDTDTESQKTKKEV